MSKAIEKIIQVKIIGLVFFLPLFFLPITSEFFLFNKQTLLITITGILLVLWTLKFFEKKAINFKKTPFDLPILFLGLAFVLGTIFASPNKAEAFMGQTATATVLTLTALYFIITNNLEGQKTINRIFYASIVSAGILGLIAIYQSLGLGEALNGPEWLKSQFFTPAGGPLILLTFLGFNLALNVVLFLKKLNQKNWPVSSGLFIIILLISLGMSLTFYQVASTEGARFTILPYRSTWAIAIEAFKQNPLFGVGPGNYLSAFNRFRSISFNQYEFWNLRFDSASSYPFELLSVGGLIALGAYLLLVFKAGRLWLNQVRSLLKKGLLVKQEANETLLAGLLVLVLIQLFLPINLLILTAFVILLAILGVNQSKSFTLPVPSPNLNLIFLVVIAPLTLVGFYFWGRAYLADYHFRQSLNALVQNQGLNTYNSQIRAINLNPQLPQYRRAYSQTNFALANSLASQPDLSDQDRANISFLVQQAIDEAKMATVLNRTDAINWENLAQLYRNLINFAQGADQWAIAAYRQTIATDPINPRIRLNLGGLFFSLGNYDEAVRHFQNAINLKPDFANAYYNLAAAYREQGKYELAFSALQAASSLVPADSADFQKVLDELEELRKKLPTAPEATPSAATGELTEPEPLPSPALEPPIELPEETGPEVTEEELEEVEAEISPSPTPTKSP